MKSRSVLTLALLGLGLAPVADAANITFDNVTATWSNGTPAANVTYSGNGTGFASANWGTGPSGPSGYDFDGAAPPQIAISIPPSPSADFVLGTFTHRNQPIGDNFITGIRLSVSADVAVDAVSQGTKTFVFDFVHNETPNGANPCANGGVPGVGVNINGCADSVTFLYSILSDSFDVGGTLFTVTLRGFEVGGSPVSTFWTTEQNDNHADLVAYVATRESVVPEPTALALLGVGLLGLAVRMRR